MSKPTALVCPNADCHIEVAVDFHDLTLGLEGAPRSPLCEHCGHELVPSTDERHLPISDE